MANPTHQAVRDYMQQRREANTPPPSPQQIREQLGWGLTQKAAEVPR